jgi:NAD(P)-dependent dehydrogenase (short-subunit alcohol dehydrogenase family)
MYVAWGGTLGLAGWISVAVWIGVLAWFLLYLEQSDTARSLPLGNVLREGYTGEDLPPGSLDGQVAVVTGASSGLGFEVALALGVRGAHVVLACRNLEKARQSVTALVGKGISRHHLEVVELDLSDIMSVNAAAEVILTAHPSIHILVNNAGVSTVFPPTLTIDQLECTFQANYLGHFQLTRLLLPGLLASRSAIRSVQRPHVVFLTSSLHRLAPPAGVWLSREDHNDFTKFGLSERCEF